MKSLLKSGSTGLKWSAAGKTQTERAKRLTDHRPLSGLAQRHPAIEFPGRNGHSRDRLELDAGAEQPKRQPRRRRASRHLFENWGKIERRLKGARHLAIFLDFDGTLAPFRDRPEDVKLPPSTRDLLGRLARHPSVTLCIISGRRRADLQKRVNARRVIYLGLHGWERDTGARASVAARELLAPTRSALAKQLVGLPHIWLRDKGPCFEIHFQGANGTTIRKARQIVRTVVRPISKDARILAGRKIWEVLPREIKGKGAAVRALLAEFARPVLSIYVGDDTSDESAFKALPNGITVRVGKPRRTRARFELCNPEEVFNFLRRVEDHLT